MSTAEAVCNCGGQTYWQQAHGWCSCISEGLRYSVYLVYQGEQGSRGNLHAASYPYAVVWSKADAWFKGFVWGLWNSQMVWLGLKLSHTAGGEFGDQAERFTREHTGQVSPAVVMQSGVSLSLGVSVGTAKGCRCSQSKILFGIQGLPPMHTHSSLSPHQIYYWDNYPPNWAEGSDGRLLYASFCAKLTVAVGLSQLPPVPLGFALQIYSSGKIK